MKKTRKNKFRGRRFKETVANFPVPDTSGSLWYNRARITEGKFESSYQHSFL